MAKQAPVATGTPTGEAPQSPQEATLNLDTGMLTLPSARPIKATTKKAAPQLNSLRRINIVTGDWKCSLFYKRGNNRQVWHAQAYIGNQPVSVYIGMSLTFNLIVEKVAELRSRVAVRRANRPRPPTIKQIEEAMQGTTPDAVRNWLASLDGEHLGGVRERVALASLIDLIYPLPERSVDDPEGSAG